jgi:hypothetical protein
MVLCSCCRVQTSGTAPAPTCAEYQALDPEIICDANQRITDLESRLRMLQADYDRTNTQLWLAIDRDTQNQAVIENLLDNRDGHNAELILAQLKLYNENAAQLYSTIVDLERQITELAHYLREKKHGK